VRVDSPAVLATAGTLAIHLLLAVFGDAVVVLNPLQREEPPPQVELIDVEPVVKPPPEPPPEEKQEPEPEQEAPKPVAQPVQKVSRRSAPPPPSNEPPPPPSETSPSSGGGPIATMEGMPPPSATGIPVVGGKRPGDRIGRGGTGTGTGAGSGAGSSDLPQPVSIATIKKQAMPKGDFGYLALGKDYPAEAKTLGIEGAIRVRLLVDDTGKVKSATLVSKLGHGLDELALERAKQIVFEPARDTDDKPVSSTVIWTFTMTIPK
jgi:periplasmic protein TonB